MKLRDLLSLKVLASPEHDFVHNRRRLAYLSIAFTVYWAHLILAVYIFALAKSQASDAAIIAAFLAVPGTIAGMNVWKYLIASEKKDAYTISKNSKSASTSSIDSTSTLES